MRTLIENGTLVNATGLTAADLLIDGETIAAILEPGSALLGFDIRSKVDRVIEVVSSAAGELGAPVGG